MFNENYSSFQIKIDTKKEDYLIKFNELKNNYTNISLLNYFLKEISLKSYDYSPLLRKENSVINIIINMNNKYIYPSIVSINSALNNSNKNRTTLIYHILCPNDIRKSNINKLKSLINIYPTNLEMIFYNMGNLFSKYKSNRFSEVTFYRLLCPLFIPVERIIYLDSDVLIFDDLQEMYNLPFNNNYVLGFLDILNYGVDYLGLISEKYINAGVLLINLAKIRNDNKCYEMLYMAKYNNNLHNNDQTIINFILYPNIGLLPFKYGIFNFDSIFDIKYLYMNRIRQKLNLSELIRAFNNPSIMHYTLCVPKIWYSDSKFVNKYTRSGTINKLTCKKYHNIWIEYSKKTSFYKEIVKFYKIKT